MAHYGNFIPQHKNETIPASYHTQLASCEKKTE